MSLSSYLDERKVEMRKQVAQRVVARRVVRGLQCIPRDGVSPMLCGKRLLNVKRGRRRFLRNWDIVWKEDGKSMKVHSLRCSLVQG